MGEIGGVSSDLDSRKQNASKPKSLFERILMQTHKISLSKTGSNFLGESNGNKLDSSAGGKSTVENDEEQPFGGEELIGLIDVVLCTKDRMSERVMKLKSLTERCSGDASILEFVISDRLLKYCESLLISYCDPSSKLKEELCMIIPLLSLFLTYSDGVETNKIDTLFVQNSDFVYQLMRACVMCVAGSLSLSQELSRITWRKKLAGRVRRVGKEDPMETLIRSLGIQSGPSHVPIAASIDLTLESYQITLFDTTASHMEKNINEHLAGMQLSTFPDHQLDSGYFANSSSLFKSSGDEEKSEEIWSDVVVAHVLPFEGFVAYMKGDWGHWLKLINGELVEFLRSSTIRVQKNEDSEIKIGSIVGFWCADVTFKWKPLMLVQCLRGIVVGKAMNEIPGEAEDVSWAIWAVDVGSLVLGKKVWPLKGDFTSIPPLVSICSLDFKEKGGNGREYQFLMVTLKLLSKLLVTNPSAGRHMVTYGPRKVEDGSDGMSDDCKTCDGGVILKLIEHPAIEIRIEFLKLMLFLARSTLEILRYLIECRFDLTVYSRLEICVHFSNAIPSDSSLWTEIRLLIMVLSAMAEGSEINMTELPGHSHIQKVLTMLTQIDNHPYVRYMAAKCLASIESHKITKSRADERKRHGPCDRYASKNQRSSTALEKSLIRSKSNQKSYQCSGPMSPKGRDLLDDGTKGSAWTAPELEEPVLSVMDVGDDSSSDEESLNLPPVDAMADMTRDMDRYTKGYKVNICNDMTHELSPEKNVCQVSENRLSQIICGFLNNGVGGSVYFGINSKSFIEGLKMTRSERDNFRKGIDRMMTRSLFPEVRPACYDVCYVPVFCTGEVVKGLAFHRNWIIEVHIKALPHAIYTVTANRKCYVRKGSNCVESMSIGLRQEAAEQTKKEILQAIEEVKAKIPENREKLFSFVKNYLDRNKCTTFDSP